MENSQVIISIEEYDKLRLIAKTTAEKKSLLFQHINTSTSVQCLSDNEALKELALLFRGAETDNIRLRKIISDIKCGKLKIINIPDYL